jgi:tricorn protease
MRHGLIDGGTVTAPELGFWFASGKWQTENHGVAPDIEVEYDPELVQAVRDPQSEAAVSLLLKDLEQQQVQRPATFDMR